MIKRIGLLGLFALVFAFVISMELFISTPKVANAFSDLKEGDCSQCHQDGRKAPGQSGQAAEPAKPAESAESAQSSETTKPAQPVQPVQSTQPTQPAELTQPKEPTGQVEAQQVNNTLPVAGFVGALIVISGAIYMDKRK